MKTINLRWMYPHYRHDEFVDVTDEIWTAMYQTQREMENYERHCFFTEQLIAAGVDPRIAEVDACRIEHIISNESFSRLKEAVAQEQD